jgi:hypothetical protein
MEPFGITTTYINEVHNEKNKFRTWFVFASLSLSLFLAIVQPC